LAEPVTAAIGASVDEAAIAALLANPSAQIREETLDRIVDRAGDMAAWHRPLVERPRLSPAIATKLAGFIADHLLRLLSERHDLDAATTAAVASVVKRRLGDGEAKAATAMSAGTAASKADDALARARQLRTHGKLDEAVVLAAAGNDRMFARAALAVLAELPLEVVERVLAAHSPKGVTALAWKSGFAMRAAHKLQLHLGQIAPAAALKPRQDGGYPLSAEAMRWQLEFFAGMGHRP
jgi:uncharacterized protein (DUF2336 family)